MGGGGGGGGWSSIGDLRALEEKAKAALNSGRRNVFISFAMEDEREVNLLRAHAKNENSEIDFNDHSVREPYDSDRAAYIKDRISERINRASICVVYLSDSTAQSRWVKWEVDEAMRRGKKVIAVHPKVGRPASDPAWIREHNIPVVAWANLPKHLK